VARLSEVASPSPAAGVRALRRRIDARGALATALSRLEADYERLLGTAGLFRQASPRRAASSRRARRSTAVAPDTERPRQDVSFVPTPHALVDTMLAAADVTQDDVVYDLGCGDGRIVITAAKRCGARGVGIDIDPRRIEEARGSAASEGVADKVSFLQKDLFATDVREATVVMLYLLPWVNKELRRRLLEQLRPGSRVVSHAFDMGDWPPAQTLTIDGSLVYRWTVPG
jgi:SAM-dependent methyltransferase